MCDCDLIPTTITRVEQEQPKVLLVLISVSTGKQYKGVAFVRLDYDVFKKDTWRRRSNFMYKYMRRRRRHHRRAVIIMGGYNFVLYLYMGYSRLLSFVRLFYCEASQFKF